MTAVPEPWRDSRGASRRALILLSIRGVTEKRQCVSRTLVTVTLLVIGVFPGCGGFESPMAPTPLPTTGNAVDMGNPADEAHHALKGWGGVNTGLTVPPESEADRTSRYQLVRLANSLELAVAEPFKPFTLAFRTEDGSCDDSFDVYVNGQGPLYQYRHRQSADHFPTHRVPVAADVMPTTIATVTFQNVAVDNCGFAAVFYVRVE